MSHRWIAVVLVVALSLSLMPPPTFASGSWLDAPLTLWNGPGMALPSAPTLDEPIDAGSATQARAPETAEDEALVAVGWQLFAPLQAGWGVKVIEATAGYDGMGRPIQYQAFVFVDGALAGTLSPELMSAGADGALERVTLLGADTIVAEFGRYTESDPLGGPSGITTVGYQIDRGGPGPVVVPVSTSTSLIVPATAVRGPSIVMDIDEDEVQVGEKFTISIEARADDGVERIVWFATGTDDANLQQPREADCGGAGVCRYSWPVIVQDVTGQIMIHAVARDLLGRESQALVQGLRVREASTSPELTLEISEEKVSVGQQFTIQLAATSGDGIDKLIWRGTGTDDIELQQPREYDCGGASSCRSSWPVTTKSTTGQVTIVATARDVHGRHTEEIVQELKVGKATSKPTVELKISRSTVSAGERFKIEVHARSGQALDKIWWYATDTSDGELKRNHESKCDGSEACRATWEVETTDSSGTITIVAKARDKSGRESDRVTQKLRVVR